MYQKLSFTFNFGSDNRNHHLNQKTLSVNIGEDSEWLYTLFKCIFVDSSAFLNVKNKDGNVVFKKKICIHFVLVYLPKYFLLLDVLSAAFIMGRVFHQLVAPVYLYTVLLNCCYSSENAYSSYHDAVNRSIDSFRFSKL